MRVEVDRSRCQGYANCVAVAPDIFDLDDDTGQAKVVQQPSEALQDAAQEAVAGCPVQAITAVEEQ